MTTTSSFDSTLTSLGITNSSTAQSTSNTTGKTTLDQADFLKLMTAQLQNQDPFNPVDNTQMVSQMAQFSTLSGQTEMNSTLKAIAAKLGATSTSDAMSWVGKNVLTEGSVAYPNTDGTLQAAVDLSSDATDVKVTIQNANGATLRTVSLGPQSAGTVNFVWDGSTDSGDAAGSGPFTITASAENGTDKVDAQPLVWAPVTSVQMTTDGDPVLTLPGIGQVPSSAVRSVG
ncbi:flagellar hook capping FlgD N-terminal domain-containing protein [Stakelama sediminis]|uniref:Basal-body rod modification protein FlgD n=1 Tax=Stakelama sediminis TaxID=463200 RepID=A0A840YWU9_9SPHN|nr:flagellar hook capping FlgD N-terminal domain-containing protein [Stakelama sediminis]MBB5718014.1 flagellar basal-body rod modification protein FlgD [Stakelama sediminis]